MKNILSSLNESEKKRILEMHNKASKRHYLNEQDVPAAKITTAAQLKNKEYIDEPGFILNQFRDNKGLFASFDPETGTGYYQGFKQGSSQNYKITYNVKCKCDTGNGMGNHETKYAGGEGFTSDQISTSKPIQNNTGKWFTERCKIYLQGKCGPVLATRAELDNVWKNHSSGSLDPSDRVAICKFVKAQQGYMTEFTGYNQKIQQVLGDIKHFKPGTDQKTFDDSDYADKGKLFCIGWGL